MITLVVYGAICAGTATFLIACVARAVRYQRLPVHMRWELYPVPHEQPEKARHGGSYLEDGDWWTRPRHFSLAGEIRFMVPEMVLLKGLWEWNRALWYRSFPFHFGLYLLAAALLLLVATAVAAPLVPPDGRSTVEPVATAIIRVTGAIGACLALAGAAALLHRRLTDPALRIYSVPADLFNLVFFIVAIAVTGAGSVTAGPEFPGALAFTRALLRFDTTVSVPTLLAAGLVLTSALVAYIPLTHMAHFISKYFTYHAVRWDDRPNARGSKLEHRIAACLAMRPTWSAGHIGADGSKTWVDVATTNPAAGGQK